MATFVYTSLMNFTQLSSSAVLATSAAQVVYANPSGASTFVGEIEIHNTTSSAVSIVLWLVPNSSSNLGTPSQFNETLKMSISANDTVWIEPKIPYVLQNTNDAFFGVAGTSGVNIQVRGTISR